MHRVAQRIWKSYENDFLSGETLALLGDGLGIVGPIVVTLSGVYTQNLMSQWFCP